MCKPMGKFAENFNLGKHVLPPLHVLLLLYIRIHQRNHIYINRISQGNLSVLFPAVTLHQMQRTPYKMNL